MASNSLREIRFKPYPFEIAAWAGFLAAVVFLRSRGLRIDWRTFEYTIPPLLPAMGRYLLVGIVLYLVYLKLRRHRVGRVYDGSQFVEFLRDPGDEPLVVPPRLPHGPLPG